MLAVVSAPSAIELAPLAVVRNPMATDRTPMFWSSHSVPATPPARKADFPGYHMNRSPPPVAGTTRVPNPPEASNPPPPIRRSCPSCTACAANPPVASRCTSVFGTLSAMPLAGAASVPGSHTEPFHVSTCPLLGAVVATVRPTSLATLGFGYVPERSPPAASPALSACSKRTASPATVPAPSPVILKPPAPRFPANARVPVASRYWG